LQALLLFQKVLKLRPHTLDNLWHLLITPISFSGEFEGFVFGRKGLFELLSSEKEAGLPVRLSSAFLPNFSEFSLFGLLVFEENIKIKTNLLLLVSIVVEKMSQKQLLQKVDVRLQEKKALQSFQPKVY